MEKETKSLPHVGEMIAARIFKRRIVKSALAREIKKSPQVINAYLLRPSLSASVLWELSVVMKHNFFLDIAELLPTDFTTNIKIDTTKDDRIKTLEAELIRVTQNLEVLKEILIKRNS